MPLLRRRRIIAAKIESVPGVAEALVAADAAFNASNVTIQANIPFTGREGQGGFSPLPGIMAARSGTVTFDIEVATNGSAGNPGWATTFLPACGVVNTATTLWSPRSLPPGGAGSPKTITIAVYEDGVRKTLRGCMGNMTLRATDGQPIMASFTFMGIWDTPTDLALLAPTYPSVRPIRFFDAAITLAAVALPPMQEFTLDLGNDVQLREDAANASGYRHAIITNRTTVGTINPEETLVATRNEYADLLAATTGAFSLGLGPPDNAIIISVPVWQRTNVQESDRNGIQVHTINWQANRNLSAGDDDFVLEFTG